MKKQLVAVAMTACTLLMGVGVASAQDGEVPQFRPVELWACNYRDGKDQEDFDDALEKLVEATGDDPYAAFQLTPNFRGPDQAFDLIYIGVWESGTSWGRDSVAYAERGVDADEAWEETLDCPVSVIFASMRIQADGGEPDESGDFVLAISDCNVAHGSSTGQALGAVQRFNDYQVANGSTVGKIAWFPVYGGGNAEFDFKLLNVYSGPQQVGDAFQWFIDNQAYLVQEDMMEGLLSCDVARLYNGSTIMNNLPN